MTVYTKGRTSWDSKRLDGYALAHPEIAACRTVGAIRKHKDNKPMKSSSLEIRFWAKSR